MQSGLSIYDFGFLHNPVFWSGVSSWFIAQFLKVVIALFQRKKYSPLYYLNLFLWSTGGMPSSHSALVTSIAAAIGYTEGMDSSLFIAMACYAGLTVRDAVGVRRSAGIQARVLNTLGSELKEKYGIPYKPVKEVNGHTVTESLMGMALGFFIATAYCNL
ncbi:MAG: divergent PAP2 family protein [Spirochaetia bacterium]|nr:divergent PAP2 family protein [Spirochaetia bacterium]